MTSPAFEIPTTEYEAARQALASIVGPERVSATQADRALHARDQSAHVGHLPDLVVWPRTTQEVSEILRHANQVGLPVTAWGAGTSIEGNPIPVYGGIVLNFQQMNQILEIHTEDFQVTVQPGIFYRDMNKILARHGLFFAPDPGANASIGGMVANNAAGIRTVKYGATRDNVLSLEVVLANGEVIQTGSRSVKQSSGYDLTHLLVGSEGTLGVVTAATLKLAPIPEHYSAVTVAFPSVEVAAQVVYEIIGAGLDPSALELLDRSSVALLNTEPGIDLTEIPHLFMEFNGASLSALQETLNMAQEICDAYDCEQFQAGLGQAERNRLWELRHAFFEIALRRHPGQDYYVSDVAVPISQYPHLVRYLLQSMAEAGLEGGVLGHAGDGNVHTVFFFPPDDAHLRATIYAVHDRLVDKAIELSGTSTGEHGVGLGKQKYMLNEHGPIALELMRQIKQVFDPKGILNPGKIFGP